MANNIEEKACTPVPVDPSLFNPNCKLPYDLTTAHIHQAMNEFIEFLGFINQQLHKKGIPRLERNSSFRKLFDASKFQ